MKVLSIIFYLKEGSYNKFTNDYKLYFRVNYNRKSKAMTTDYRLPKKSWGPERQMSLDDEDLNEEILWIKNRFYEIKRELTYKGKPISAKILMDIFQGGEAGKTSLKSLLTNYMEVTTKVKKYREGTLRVHRSKFKSCSGFWQKRKGRE